IGLQSSHNFTIPFISSVDFRINSRSITSALNSDGWFSIWVLNPLTYPPQTPTNQAIVLMASAGSDFSYRLPISPPFVQNGVHENAEKGTTENTDATQTAGHAVGLTTNHSNCAFFFDRYRLVATAESVATEDRQIASVFAEDGKIKEIGELYSGNNKTNHYITLGPNPSISTTSVSAYIVVDHVEGSSHYYTPATNGDPFFLRSCPFTYFHSDLEVTVKPITTISGTWYVTWFPPGSNIAENQVVTSFRVTGDTAATRNISINNRVLSNLLSVFPTFHSSGGSAVSFNIPYTSPLTAIPTR
ncbi:capsid protein VP1, partial [cosavirus D2]